MFSRLFLFLALVALSLGSEYGRPGMKKLTCSGQPLSKLGFNRQDISVLAGTWYNKFFKTTLAPVGRPTNVFIRFEVGRNSNKAIEIVSGNNPNKPYECLTWTYRDFQIYDDIPCYAEKGLTPEVCADEEWIHYVFTPSGSNNKLLFFYYCADESPTTKCSKYLTRCLFDTPYINNADRKACHDLFYKFNLGKLPAEDLGSAKNACQKNKYPVDGYNYSA